MKSYNFYSTKRTCSSTMRFRSKQSAFLFVAPVLVILTILVSRFCFDQQFIDRSNGGAMADHEEDTIFNSPYFVIYKNGSCSRSGEPPAVPTGVSTATGVASKDVVIDAATGVFARVFLPTKLSRDGKKLPVVVYFHGGAFVLASAVDATYNAYAESIAHQAEAIVVSVQYRLAPEHHCPAAYDDSWAAVEWVASRKDPWIAELGDLARLFFAGDSAGGNIAHNLLIKAGATGAPTVEAGILLHPWFDGEGYLHGELPGVKAALSAAWRLYCPNAKDGLDDARMNPLVKGAPSLSTLGCARLFVAVGGADALRARGTAYYGAVTTSGWRGQAELWETTGEGHCFFVHQPGTKKAAEVMNRVVAFIEHRGGGNGPA